MNVVFDTNIFVSAAANPSGLPRQLVERGLTGDYNIFLSDELFGYL